MSTAPDDLTGRARLRDAAIECFAAHGFGESLRTIAARAGVTAGLVRHHFGSKESLRAECDAKVLERYHTMKVDSLNVPATRLFAQLPSSREGGLLMVYILRSIQDGGPTGRTFFESMVSEAVGFTKDAVARGLVVPSRDEDARTRFLVQQSIGSMLVNLAMRPDVRLDDFPAVMDQYMADSMLPTLELYTEGLFADSSYLDQYLAFTAGNHPPAAPADEASQHQGNTKE
ncbi:MULTISPECIES: TetR/AcrR family transcriptional regulator [unclassified Arthrobacter]|uniref:TetR/AcrR family transcriptional regulator n=1 Tax=unclassified Arthrobacter TaxID=235627 RepID=UPI00159E3A30|nr:MULTISPECIES: TetR family transcriptional regulator [unclassified Arthrobacter]MCQ9166144.1 TetR family transcriptional regulator [Arthrobacter sp. STN4]NVN00740.1 helix-turn-helix transcriptional regulator [Arthrobacter sp. SDTb3-6]